MLTIGVAMTEALKALADRLNSLGASLSSTNNEKKELKNQLNKMKHSFNLCCKQLAIYNGYPGRYQHLVKSLKSDKKNSVGEFMFLNSEPFYGPLTGKLVGMMLEMEYNELLEILSSIYDFHSKMGEAYKVLMKNENSNASKSPLNKEKKPPIAKEKKWNEVVRSGGFSKRSNENSGRQTPNVGKVLSAEDGERSPSNVDGKTAEDLMKKFGNKIQTFDKKPGREFVELSKIPEKLLVFITGNSNICYNFDCNLKCSCQYGKNCQFLHIGIWNEKLYVGNLEGIKRFMERLQQE